MEFLRAKQLLLVLDNCEHLLDAAADLAKVLARSCERLVILATSRSRLHLRAEVDRGRCNASQQYRDQARRLQQRPSFCLPVAQSCSHRARLRPGFFSAHD